MISCCHEEHCASPHGAWHGIAQQAFFHHENARGSGAADELVARKEYGVLGNYCLQSTFTWAMWWSIEMRYRRIDDRKTRNVRGVTCVRLLLSGIDLRA